MRIVTTSYDTVYEHGQSSSLASADEMSNSNQPIYYNIPTTSTGGNNLSCGRNTNQLASTSSECLYTEPRIEPTLSDDVYEQWQSSSAASADQMSNRNQNNYYDHLQRPSTSTAATDNQLSSSDDAYVSDDTFTMDENESSYENPDGNRSHGNSSNTIKGIEGAVGGYYETHTQPPMRVSLKKALLDNKLIKDQPYYTNDTGIDYAAFK